jgi:hypothetical protein
VNDIEFKLVDIKRDNLSNGDIKFQNIKESRSEVRPKHQPVKEVKSDKEEKKLKIVLKKFEKFKV